jgi:hypothetical protein
MTFRSKKLALAVCLLALGWNASAKADPILLTDPWTGFFVHTIADYGLPGNASTILFQDQRHVPTTGPSFSANAVGSKFLGDFYAVGSATGNAQIAPALTGFTTIHVDTSAYGYSFNRSSTDALNLDVASKFVGGFILDKATKMKFDYDTASFSKLNGNPADVSGRFTISTLNGPAIYTTNQSGSVELNLAPGTYRLDIESIVKWTNPAGDTTPMNAGVVGTTNMTFGPVAAVPEPGSFALMGFGATCAGLLSLRRRNRHTSG